jgi:hypothetical protein
LRGCAGHSHHSVLLVGRRVRHVQVVTSVDADSFSIAVCTGDVTGNLAGLIDQRCQRANNRLAELLVDLRPYRGRYELGLRA